MGGGAYIKGDKCSLMNENKICLIKEKTINLSKLRWVSLIMTQAVQQSNRRLDTLIKGNGSSYCSVVDF
jgi:hypothetical protein